MVTNKPKRIFNRTRGRLLAGRAVVAGSFLARLRGLLFSPRLLPGQGLYLCPCRSIHMFGMSYPIDAVFVDRRGTVVGLVESIAPGRVSAFYPQASGCVELPAGTIRDTTTALGDEIEFCDCR